MPSHARRDERRRDARRRVRRVVTWAAPTLLTAAVVVAPQLLGGVFGWGVAIVSGMCGAACLAAAWAAAKDERAPPLGAVGLTALGATLFTALQVLPLPRRLTGWLQPRAVELTDGASAALAEPPADWIALSLAPGATLLEVVKGAGLLAAFLAASTLVALGHRRAVFAAVGTSGIAMAVVALAHASIGADRVFGVYEPVNPAYLLRAPIVNDNQLSGFLSMCAPVLVGLGLDRDSPRARWAWLAGGVLVSATSLMAVSRGGVASLVVGFLALGMFGALRHHGRGGGPSLLVAGAAVATGIGLGLYVAAEGIYRDFERSGLEKLELAWMGLDLAVDHPWLGVGRGAFSAAFVSRFGTTTRATHPESLPAQWASEWGFPLTVLLLVVLGWALARGARRAKSWAHGAAAAGVVAIFVHDLVDYALELSGIAAVAATLYGAVVAEGRRTATAPTRLPLHKIAAGAGAIALLLPLTLASRVDQLGVRGMQRRLETQLRTRDPEFAASLLTAVRTHPSEPAFPLLGGSEAAQRGDPAAVRWLNRAMVLAPSWGAPHEEAARYLFLRGHPQQGLLEVREAGVRDRTAAARFACPPLSARPELAGAAIRSLGADPTGDQMLDRLGRCLPRDAPAAIEIDTYLTERGVLGATLRMADRALHASEPARALALLAPIQSREPRLVALRARAHLAAGEPTRALEALAGAEETAQLLELRARAQAAAGDEAAMLETLERMRARVAGSAEEIAQVWALEGRLQEGLDHQFAALRAYGRAERLDPGRDTGLQGSARVAERVGDLARAYRAHAELCQRRGSASRACREQARLRRALDESRRRVGQPVGTP